MDTMWFQNGTTSKRENSKYRSEKYLAYVFTELGKKCFGINRIEDKEIIKKMACM